MLKLFVSHSSRLDDVDHKYSRDDRNWRLLEDTCRAIREAYGDRVEVLVDNEGLIPGEDWNRRLNLWLAECHVAVILFSKRAREKSDWVAKEAAVLSWRADLDKDFKLIPVMLDGESQPEDLAKDFFGVLNIDRSLCIRKADTAERIVAGLIKALGGPNELTGRYPRTPLERLEGGIAQVLAESTEASLRAAVEAVGCPSSTGVGPIPAQRCARLLAREFLTATADEAQACFGVFQSGIDPLTPRPMRERAEELFRQVRPLWVQPAAAAHLPRALQHRRQLVLTGRFITLADASLKTQGYTLERYLERAWPGDSLFRVVFVAGDKSVSETKEEIRRRFLGASLPDTIDGPSKDAVINCDPKRIILVIVLGADSGGLSDPARRRDYQSLTQIYTKLVVVIALESTTKEMPEDLQVIRPSLDPRCELAAFLGERAARLFLDQKYGVRE